MALEHLEGASYGPFEFRLAAERVADYVAATGDSTERWAKAAPPSFAGALLFAVAPSYFGSEIVRRHSRVLVHADQAFSWHGPLTIDAPVRVDAAVRRVRSRGPIDFVTFVASAHSGDELWLESKSTFLHGAEPPAEPAPEHEEPPIAASGAHDDAASVEGDIVTRQRSASRLDLVRYAAASGDFNPIHFDHATGVAAGFSGVIVHGLLMSAWLTQLAASFTSGDHPLQTARFRYRQAMYPASTAVATAIVSQNDDEPRSVDMRLSADQDLVTGKATLREG